MTAEVVLEYFKSEANKFVEKKTKAKEQNVKGFVSESIYRTQRKYKRFIGCGQR